MSRPLSLGLYAAAMASLAPLAPLALKTRVAQGKEDPRRLGERLGRPSRPRRAGKLVWLHGASVGEGLSLLPLVERLREAAPDVNLLITSGTRTSAELLGERLPEGCVHQYVPLDIPAAVGRFVRHWRPDLAIFVESELWPNLIVEAKTAGSRLALISGRMSEQSFRGWRRAAGAAAALLANFDLILAKDEIARARFEALGATVDGLWDAKLGAPPLTVDQVELTRLSLVLANRPVIFAASTHPGEEAVVLKAFAQTAPIRPDALLAIAPRHPARGPELETAVAHIGLTSARRSQGGDPAGASVYVADTLGELGLFFRLARAAFIGGSLAPGVGGHNPLEPARLGCPIAAGPFTENWPVYAAFRTVQAVRIVTGEKDLAETFAAAMRGELDSLAERGRALAARLDADNVAVAPRLLALITT